MSSQQPLTPSSPEPASTPKPFPTMLPLEEKSLPPPPLDEILGEMPSTPRSPPQRDSNETFQGRRDIERKSPSHFSRRGRTSSESASLASPRAEEFTTPQLGPTRSNPSPLPSPRTFHDFPSAGVKEREQPDLKPIDFRRRRMPSRSSRSSSNASLHRPNAPIHELPDPSTFPIPPSPGISYEAASPALSASASTNDNTRHLSSDVSSGYSQSTRGSVWSSHRCSRNSSWDTHHSSPCSASLRHQSLKDASSSHSSFAGSNLTSSFDTAASSLPSHTPEAGHDGQGEDDEDDVGLGITSELECVRSSRTAVQAAPPDSPQASLGRWAHHRNPSWACKSVSQDTHPVQAIAAGLAQQSIKDDDELVDLDHTIRPPISRAMSAANIGSNAAAQAAAVDTVSAAPPHRLREARGRAYSAVSPVDRHSSMSSVSSCSDDNVPPRSVRSPIPFNPRTSSLKRSMRGEATRSPTPTTLRSAHRTAGIVSHGPPSRSHRSSIKSVEELVEDGDDRSSRSSMAGSDSLHSRRMVAGHQRTASAASSVLSLDVSALAFEFPRAFGASPSDVGNAVKLVESGKGVVVEAKGRPLHEFEHEIGPNTTHLVLCGCKSDQLAAFLDRAVAKAAHCLLVLDVSNTGLTKFPESITRCSQLEELNLSGNQLSKPVLPNSIADLTHLRVLAMDDMNLTAIPFSATRLVDLKALSVRRNRLTHLPSWLHLLRTLEHLYVDGNPFKGPWLRVIASILPKQVQYLPHTEPSPQYPTSAPILSDTSNADSPSASPVSERGQPRRRPFLQRMRSDNDFHAGAAAEFGFNARNASSSSQTDGSGGPSPKQIEEHMHRRGLVAPEGMKDSANESKWSFIRKVARKSSQGKSLAQLAASSSAGDSSAPSLATSGSSSPVQHRSATNTDPRTLPRLNTSAWRMTGSSRSRSGSLASSALGAPFHPAPARQQSQGEELDATKDATITASRRSKRMSFLPVQSAGNASTQSAGQDTSPQYQPPEEDAEDEKRRLHALMSYLRDLDDLSSRTVARRGAASDTLTGQDPTSSPSVGQRGPNTSPIRRRPSGMLLSSFSPSAAAPQPGEIKDDPMRRRRIVQEIISSEESYIRGLQELVEIYVRPARKAVDGANGQAVLSPAEHRTIFGNVEGLLQFHEGAFLPSLKLAAKEIILQSSGGEVPDGGSAEDAAMTARVAEAVAGVFTKHAAFFRMYSTYINGCDEAQSRITALLGPPTTSQGTTASFMTPLTNTTGDAKDGGVSTGQRKRFKTFMKRCRLHPRHSQLNVESYLLLPVQRIPRYELLLKDLSRSTDPQHLQNALSVSAALSEISCIAASVNESKRQSEQDRKLMAWQARMRGPVSTPLVQPHRRLIRDGTLVVRRVVNRMHAFHTTLANPDEAVLDGAFAASSPSTATSPASEAALELSNNKAVDCLRQSSPNQPVTMLLCNDCCITVRESLSNGAASAFDNSTRPVELYSMIQFTAAATSSSSSSSSASRCTVVGGTTLRMVDAHCVYYFSTRSSQEAQEWCQSINCAGERADV